MNNDNLPKGWCYAVLEDLLDYEQPTKYIVSSTDYDDSYKTPVLTAGKSFLLGNTNEKDGIFKNLPVIIFDDFTTAIKFVSFPFKVKSSAMKILIPKHSEVNMKYVYYFMETIRINVDTHKRYWISVGSKLPILIPPTSEQERIVAKIEELFSELDKGIETINTAKEQLAGYRQAVLKLAFEGRLTNPHVTKGEVPDGWCLKKIRDIANVVRGGSPRPAGDTRFYGGSIPFLKVADLTKDSAMYVNQAEHTIKEAGLRKTRQITPDTLLLTNSGATLGVPKICTISATMNDGVAAFLNLNSRSIKYVYFFWLSKTKELRMINQGAAQPNLNTEIIKSYELPYCSYDEQELVVAEIESQFSICDKIEQSIIESLQQAEALRQSILKKAFEGKLVLQDPNDEPASELLKRIKQQAKTVSNTFPKQKRAK